MPKEKTVGSLEDLNELLQEMGTTLFDLMTEEKDDAISELLETGSLTLTVEDEEQELLVRVVLTLTADEDMGDGG